MLRINYLHLWRSGKHSTGCVEHTLVRYSQVTSSFIYLELFFMFLQCPKICLFFFAFFNLFLSRIFY
jgi:hypothetical protein